MMTMPESGDGVDAVDEVVAGSGPRDDVAKALDEISLEQALVDVEVANARAIDLTSRLLSSRRELLAAKKEIADLREHVEELTAHIESITGSPGYVWATRLSKLRRTPR
jgi:hypothetical protein